MRRDYAHATVRRRLGSFNRRVSAPITHQSANNRGVACLLTKKKHTYTCRKEESQTISRTRRFPFAVSSRTTLHRRRLYDRRLRDARDRRSLARARARCTEMIKKRNEKRNRYEKRVCRRREEIEWLFTRVVVFSTIRCERDKGRAKHFYNDRFVPPKSKKCVFSPCGCTRACARVWDRECR